MAWTTPKTDWTTGELVAASDLNAIGDNLAALKHPPSAFVKTGADITAKVDEFTDIDSNSLRLTTPTAGGDVLVYFQGQIRRTNSNAFCYIDIDVDGNRYIGGDGILLVYAHSWYSHTSFCYLVQNLGAGSHTFKPQWKNSRSNGCQLHTGATFWVREI